SRERVLWSHGGKMIEITSNNKYKDFFYFGRHWPLLIVSDKMRHLNEFEVYHALHLLRQGYATDTERQ
ncbi:hypothetical protein L9F63_006624, partial [Diploptera punctata]